MRAWQVTELGEPKQVMRLVDVDDPQPAAEQLVVQVLASPANFPDILMCRGTYQVKPDLPGAGNVVAASMTASSPKPTYGSTAPPSHAVADIEAGGRP